MKSIEMNIKSVNGISLDEPIKFKGEIKEVITYSDGETTEERDFNLSFSPKSFSEYITDEERNMPTPDMDNVVEIELKTNEMTEEKFNEASKIMQEIKALEDTLRNLFYFYTEINEYVKDNNLVSIKISIDDLPDCNGIQVDSKYILANIKRSINIYKRNLEYEKLKLEKL